MSWLQTVFASLLGTAVGSAVTGGITEIHARRRERLLVVDALASVRTELLIAANRLTSSIFSAKMAINMGHLPVITDDLALMYRTHASTLHVTLSAKDMLFLTVAYSSLGAYVQGRIIKDHLSQFAFVYGFYANTLDAVYKAYMLVGERLLSRYKVSIPSEFPVFYLGAQAVYGACDAEIRRLNNATTDGLYDKNPDIMNDIIGIKGFASLMMKSMKDSGYEPTELEMRPGQAQPQEIPRQD